jgi:hypothetical protein
MDVVEIIKELRQELERIDSLILALDMLQSGRRRGRPPKLLQQLRAARGGSLIEVDAPAPVRKKSKKRRKTTVAKRGKKSAKQKKDESSSQS